MPPGFEHVAGETLFFSCRIAGYAKTPEEKVHVAYSVQAFDPKGVPLTEIYKNELVTDVTPQDKEWMPKIATEVQVPPLVASGTYKLVIKAEDMIARTNAELAVPFHIRGKVVEPSDTLVVRNFQFFRGEEDSQSLIKAVYHGGDAVWAKFDITGFKYGKDNHIDVSYVTSVISPSGKVLWTQDPARGGTERELLSQTLRRRLDGDQSSGEHQARRIHHRGHGQRCGRQPDLRDEADFPGGIKALTAGNLLDHRLSVQAHGGHVRDLACLRAGRHRPGQDQGGLRIVALQPISTRCRRERPARPQLSTDVGDE